MLMTLSCFYLACPLFCPHLAIEIQIIGLFIHDIDDFILPAPFFFSNFDFF
jgi:hypothetical protein